jgi:hypothetical protein
MATLVINLPEGSPLPTQLGFSEDTPTVVNILTNTAACVVCGALRTTLDLGVAVATPNTTPGSTAQFTPDLPGYTLPPGGWAREN